MKLTILLTAITISAAAPIMAQEAKQPAAAPEKSNAKITEVTPDEAEKQIAAGATVIDLRTIDEYEHTHIKGAKNMNARESDFEKNVAALDPKKPIVVHCQSGSRSSIAIRQVFSKSKIETIYHMGGGLSAWTKASKPVELTPTPSQSKVLPERLR